MPRYDLSKFEQCRVAVTMAEGVDRASAATGDSARPQIRRQSIANKAMSVINCTVQPSPFPMYTIA